MLRDNLRDKDYLNLFISNHKRRIVDLQDSLSEVNSDNEKILFNLNNRIFQVFLEVLIAMYSSGADISDIKAYFVENLSLFERSYRTSYSFYLPYIALATLLDIDDASKMRLNKVLQDNGTNDAFYNFLLFGKFEGRDWKFIEKYKEVIEADETERVQLVKQLLSRWYVRNKSSYWYGYHKYPDRHLYFGYWALEIGALVKILKIPDDSFKDKKYYPYDLVHFGG